MRVSRLGLLLAALAAASLPACSGGGTSGPGGGGGKKPKFAVVSNNPALFWTICEAGAKQAEKDFGCEVVFRKPERSDVPVQMDILNALVKQGYDGIAVSVIDAQNQTPDLKRIAKQTKLITMDSDAPQSDRICFVGVDNYEAGKSAGRLVKQALPGGGTVAIFIGQMSGDNARQRYQGVADELAGQKDAKGPTFGKYTLFRGEPITDGANREQAQNNTKQVLEQIGGQSNVCLVGLFAYNPPAILEAVKSKNLTGKVKIVGFDEEPNTLAGIAAGEIVGTVVQDPYGYGYKSVEILLAEYNGDTSKRAKTSVPHRLVTADGKAPPGDTVEALTVAQFQADFDKKTGKK
jgi:ribose transport system substrate-binding protein